MMTRTLVALTMLAALGGCSAGHQLAPPPGHLMRTTDGQWDVIVSSSSDTWPLNEYFDLEIRVTRGPSAPIEVRADAGMPAHRHGMNVQVDTVRTTSNTWLTQDMLLHMPGDWVLTIDVIDTSGVLHRATMPIVVH